MLDTGAEISIIKKQCLKPDIKIDDSFKINIKGVTDNIIKSYGIIDNELISTDFSIFHEFHVVSNSFNIPADGIIGKDFIKLNECILNYQKMKCYFKLNGQSVSIPMVDGPSDDTIVLPVRAEVFRTFVIPKFTQPQFINNYEIAPGVFIANSIAQTQFPILKVINTTSEIKHIPKIIHHSENLSNYNIYSMNHTQATPERNKQLSKLFMKNSPKHSHQELLPLLNEFNGIFALPDDKMTQNNFYQQKLRLSENTPVYIKNYRLPHSQKEQITKQVQKLKDNDLIEPSKSPYNSPFILVPKNTFRALIYFLVFTKLN